MQHETVLNQCILQIIDLVQVCAALRNAGIGILKHDAAVAAAAFRRPHGHLRCVQRRGSIGGNAGYKDDADARRNFHIDILEFHMLSCQRFENDLRPVDGLCFVDATKKQSKAITRQVRDGVVLVRELVYNVADMLDDIVAGHMVVVVVNDV